jgi:hypothetical protein
MSSSARSDCLKLGPAGLTGLEVSQAHSRVDLPGLNQEFEIVVLHLDRVHVGARIEDNLLIGTKRLST